VAKMWDNDGDDGGDDDDEDDFCIMNYSIACNFDSSSSSSPSTSPY